jgi:glyoxylate/hydroxypyruvate reductase
MSVGYDHVTVSELEARKIALGITPGVLTEATADTTVLLVLAAARRLREGVDAVIQGKWGTWSPTWLLGSQLTDKTVGIVGLGRIGVAVAKRLKAFGVQKFVYQGTRPKKEVEKEVGGDIEFVGMDRLLRESDVICVCCALNDKTKNMFDYEAFSKMKDTVVSSLCFAYVCLPHTILLMRYRLCLHINCAIHTLNNGESNYNRCL